LENSNQIFDFLGSLPLSTSEAEVRALAKADQYCGLGITTYIILLERGINSPGVAGWNTFAKAGSNRVK
jgi:hypothetical protein